MRLCTNMPMTPCEYIKKALRTCHKDGEYDFRGVHGVTPGIEHAVLGMASEAGELVDAIKKAKIYGHTLDRINLVEEAGDCFWYLALLCHELNVSFEEVWEKNISKLKVRYPGKWSKARAIQRDHKKERKIFGK